MNNQTTVTVVVLGGAAASVALWLAVELGAIGQPPPGVESALGVLLTAGLAWILPSDVVAKIRRRTKGSGQ